MIGDDIAGADPPSDIVESWASVKLRAESSTASKWTWLRNIPIRTELKWFRPISAEQFLIINTEPEADSPVTEKCQLWAKVIAMSNYAFLNLFLRSQRSLRFIRFESFGARTSSWICDTMSIPCWKITFIALTIGSTVCAVQGNPTTTASVSHDLEKWECFGIINIS